MITQTKRKKFNPMLFRVILFSVGLHVLAGFVAGVITIANVVIKEQAQFEEPPVVEQEEPPLEVKVEIRPEPPKPQNIQQQLSMRPVANIAVAQVDVNLPSMEQDFTVSAGFGGINRGGLLGGAADGHTFKGIVRDREGQVLRVFGAKECLGVTEQGSCGDGGCLSGARIGCLAKSF